jgi:hypothetical protein
MRDAIAIQRYLERHIEPDLPSPPITEDLQQRWQHVLVIPVYRESPEFFDQLKNLNVKGSHLVTILVINRPDTDPDKEANSGLRSALQNLRTSSGINDTCEILPLGEGIDLYVHDLEQLSGATDAAQGVGLVRKIGCDIAFKWINAGVIETEWICCTDADATLPANYFLRTDAPRKTTVAALAPFTHSLSDNEAINVATALYELRLHHYVLGLQFAGSPYAFHTLGSCLQLRASAYAHCRGFPKRSGAEDFYLLNKLRKLGDVTQLKGQCIQLAARDSARVPFGTGPAVTAIILETEPLEAELFYHPETFLALRAFLRAIPSLYAKKSLEDSLSSGQLEKYLTDASIEALNSLGIYKALDNFRGQSRNAGQFEGHMHRWFDGFRTLKFLHALRDADWPLLPLTKTFQTKPKLWPPGLSGSQAIEDLRSGVYEHLGWIPNPLEPNS